MKLSTIFFDLDGTLLPMDQDVFVKAYFKGLAATMAPHGIDGPELIDAVWQGTRCMVCNDGECTNEERFWKYFARRFGRDVPTDIAIFEEYYRTEFQKVAQVCGCDPRAAQTIRALKAMGYRLVLATNPLFPSIATESRIRWAGLDREDFVLCTTYDDCGYCKPNPAYYRDLLERLGLEAGECLMVGNDVTEDMVAETLGMRVFLLTDCLINKEGRDITRWPHGSFEELMHYVGGEAACAPQGRMNE